jgi:exodeoxyribonuclease III
MIDAKFTDTFRSLYPDQTNAFTWWSNFGGARAKNVGWRIDYWMASASAQHLVKGAEIHPKVMGSDHCPVSITVDSF